MDTISTSNRNQGVRLSLQRGSFSLVLDAQLDSLRQVREEKDFAKAVKADEAEVPV